VKQIVTTKDLADYITHLDYVVNHHARNMAGLWQQVLAGVIQHADEPLKVRTHLGTVTASAWAVIGGQRFMFGAERLGKHNYAIVVKLKGCQGPVVAAFTDQLTPDDVRGTFIELKALGIAQAA